MPVTRAVPVREDGAVSIEPARRADGPRGRIESPNRLSLGRRIWRDRAMLLLAIPGLMYFVVFHYVPLLGYVVAFQNYKPFLGFRKSPFVGFDNFTYIVSDVAFWQAL
ncbi:MAG TPA: sugar ABC transporter permease, partial [Bacillota bacterium]|nr:sugar ABC transporter permease [Bacillota bacterium]